MEVSDKGLSVVLLTAVNQFHGLKILVTFFGNDIIRRHTTRGSAPSSACPWDGS